MEVPGGGKDVLLHSCCAPCSGAVIECLLANGIRPVVFFSNSNITPFEEYELRRSELARYCKSLGVEMIDDEYDHDAWRNFVLGVPQDGRGAGRTPSDFETAGQFCIMSEVPSQPAAAIPEELEATLSPEELAAAPERGPRCLNCFKFRLKRAAEYAAAHGIPILTTTLASSRWKSQEQVAEAGLWACGGMPDQVGHDVMQAVNDENPVGHDVLFWPQNWRKGGLQERRSQIICEQRFYNQTWCGCEFSQRP